MKQKRLVVMLWLLAMLCSVCRRTDTVRAETQTKVYITEGALNHALNRTMNAGEMRVGWKIELNNGRTVKSARWTSTDTSIMTVEGNEKGATVTAQKEGTAKLVLAVITNKEETVTNDCIISVITKLEEKDQPAGYVKSSANFYRGASIESEVRNTGGKGQKLTVIALCGDFFRVRLPKDYEFGDTLNQDTTYAKKSDIAIPVTQVRLKETKETRTVRLGETIELSMEYQPELATEKDFLWKSSNPDLISVSQSGKVLAKKTGSAVISVQEKSSGKTDSCKFIVTRQMPLSASVSKPRLYIKKDNDFRGNHISWHGLPKAKQYKLYIGLWNKKKKKVIYRTKNSTKKSYYDTDIIKGKRYHYYVKGYDAEGKLLAKSKKVKIKATAPQLTAEPISMGQIRLDWKEKRSKNLRGIKGYRIYRSEKEHGTYKCIKNIKRKKTFSWTDSKRKSGKLYFYKICAYQKRKGKTKNGSKSAAASAKTYNTISEMTNWNYFNSMKDVWNGVYMQRGKVTEQQSTAIMNQYGFELADEKEYPYIKYHLTTDTLYIHIYVDYCTYTEQNGKLVRHPVQDQQFMYHGQAQGGTYKQEFENGLYTGYRMRIEGNAEDFAPGVNFDTRLILHEKGKETVHKDQRFLNVKIGGECEKNCSFNHWFHANIIYGGSVSSATSYLYMPRNDQLQGHETLQGFRDCAMHEMGHILGLDDAYSTGDKNGYEVKRLIYNDETCFILMDRTRDNIMNGYRKEMTMTANDIEMILYAYGHCIKYSDKVLQSYKDYILNLKSYNISDVIRNRKDERNGGTN